MSFWSAPIRVSEAKCILRQQWCGFGSRERSSLPLAVSKSSMRPENRSTRKTRTQIAPIVRFCRSHCRGSDQEPTRWPGVWCQSIHMSPKAISDFRFSGKDETNFPVPRAWHQGLLAELRQDTPAAHSAFNNARSETEKLVRAQPGNATPLTVLALIDAELGEKEKAIHEARTAW